MKLTTASLANLKLASGDKDRIWFDDDVPGFGLRVRDTGSRSWIYQYKIGGKTRRLVLGQATAIKLARAREIAGELHAKVRLGGDPAAEKRAQIARSVYSRVPCPTSSGILKYTQRHSTSRPSIALTAAPSLNGLQR
jgi:hypothetical protein